MKILAFDTSSMVASVAIIDEYKTLGEVSFNYKKQHSTILLPMIDYALKALDITIKDIDCIACAKGPGSFTGLRIGASTAKGLCQGANKPLIGISTLEGLAYNSPYFDGLVCPIIDALREDVYASIYKWKNDRLDIIDANLAVNIEELLNILSVYNQKVLFLGDGIFVHKEIIQKKLKDKAIFAMQHFNMQKASSIGALALSKFQRGEIDDYMSFAPIYIRASQAEREYEKKHREDKLDGEC